LHGRHQPLGRVDPGHRWELLRDNARRGGSDTCNPPYGCGTVFKITPGGKLTTLHRFDGTDGYDPSATLVQAADGNFYGTTGAGGASDSCNENGITGCGTIFRITPGGKLTTLYSFCSQNGCTDGKIPGAGLVQGTNGNFYGTTLGGGANDDGTVFKTTRSGRLTTLHSFDETDGETPDAALIQASDGKFYGTTVTGGSNGEGTVFKIAPNGTLTTLYNFCSQEDDGVCTDGQNPYAALVQDANGTFYGTTGYGGVNDFGTVFSLSVGSE
jgi:uncharacterized repeat protein (TIGR03803 family)